MMLYYLLQKQKYIAYAKNTHGSQVHKDGPSFFKLALCVGVFVASHLSAGDGHNVPATFTRNMLNKIDVCMYCMYMCTVCMDM